MGGCSSAETKGQVTKGTMGPKKFEPIRDRFETIEQVQKGLRDAGLESSDVILAIDLTKSNEWSGTECFGGAHLLSAINLCMQAQTHTYVIPGSCSVDTGPHYSSTVIREQVSMRPVIVAGQSLHSTTQTNPYKSVISIICKTLSGEVAPIK
jgi:hypothetical protein